MKRHSDASQRHFAYAAERCGVFSLAQTFKRGRFDATWAKLGETWPRVGGLAGEEPESALRCPLHDAQHATVQPLRRALRLDAPIIEPLGNAAQGFAPLV
jgi:hypothetical protein